MMDKIKITKPKKAELRLIADYYGKSGDPPWDPFSSAKRMALIPQKGFFIARVDGTFAGFIYWFDSKNPWFDKKVRRYARIEELHVVKKFRGKGIGKILLEVALDDIKKSNITTIYLETNENNSVARHIYEKYGFKIKEKKLHYKLKN